MAASDYKVETALPDMYLDAGGKPVRGYVVRVTLTKYAELHDIQVPSLDPKVVKAAIEKLSAQRDALAALGV